MTSYRDMMESSLRLAQEAATDFKLRALCELRASYERSLALVEQRIEIRMRELKAVAK